MEIRERLSQRRKGEAILPAATDMQKRPARLSGKSKDLRAAFGFALLTTLAGVACSQAGTDSAQGGKGGESSIGVGGAGGIEVGTGGSGGSMPDVGTIDSGSLNDGATVDAEIVDADVDASQDASIDAALDAPADAANAEDSSAQDASPADCDFLTVSIIPTPLLAIPAGANNVEMACYSIENGCMPHTLNTLAVQKNGPSGNSLLMITFAPGTKTDAAFDQNAIAIVPFPQPNLVPNSVTEFCVYGDILPIVPSGDVSVSIESADALNIDAQVIKGAFPLKGPEHVISDSLVGTVSFDNVEENQTLPAGPQTDAILTTLEVSVNDIEAIGQQEIKFALPGSCDQVSNFRLIEKGVVLATAAKAEQGFVTFETPGLWMLFADSSTQAQIRADTNCLPQKTVGVCLDDKDHFTGFGLANGFGPMVQNSMPCIPGEYTETSFQ